MQEQLQAGLKSLGLELEPSLCTSYLNYIELLSKWNKAYNLTAIKEPGAMLNRHVLDSLSVLSFIEGERCLDIGTGAGLPGMILALAQPDKHWTLLDSNQKKIRFLQHVLVELNVKNVELVHSRIEAFEPEKAFDTVICRAFAPLTRMLEQAQHLLLKENQLLAMKSRQVKAEIEELGEHEFLIKLNDLALSDGNSPTTLLQIRRTA